MMKDFEENVVETLAQQEPNKVKPRAKKYKNAAVLSFDAQRHCLAYECEGIVCQVFTKGAYTVGETIKVDAEDMSKVAGEAAK